MELDIAFRKTWRSLDLADDPAETYRWLTTQYEAPTRWYHRLSHISHGLNMIDKIGEFTSEPHTVDIIKFAFWFHDSLDDEAQSSNIAQFVLATNRRTDLMGKVKTLIELTKHDTVPRTTAERIMVDSDLAIFAEDIVTFNRYEINVRKKYPNVSDNDFYKARRKILSQFLNRDSIYYSIYARREMEHLARNNLLDSIKALSKLIK